MAEHITVAETVAHARDLMLNESDYVGAQHYLESALELISKRTRNVNDAFTLGKWKDAQKRLSTELQLVKDIIQELDSASGMEPGIAGPGPSSGAERRGSDVRMPDVRGMDQGYDNGQWQREPVSHVADNNDPEVWRPPTRDGPPPAPVRVQPARAAAPPRARVSSDNNLPQWSRNANGAQVVNIPMGNAAAGPGPRAISAQRQHVAPPARVVGGGNARGAGAGGRGDGYDRPWRQNMAGGRGGGAGPSNAGAGHGGQAAQGQVARKINYVGPDADLAAMLERDLLDASPGIRWTDIAGLKEAKRVLEEAAVLPLIMPEYFTGIRKPFKGVLLFGPPGTGKTMLAKACATETSCTFFNVSSATLASKYRGESERLVRCLFDLARVASPSIIFIDEVDSLCAQRGTQNEHEASRRVKTELLTQIDGCHSAGPEGEPPRRVMVLAATNFPWDIDEALRRRLEKRIYIPLPVNEERLELLRLNLKDVELGDDVNMEEVASKLDGYSGDDITNICRDAALNGMRRVTAGRSPLEIAEMKRQGHDFSKEPVIMPDFTTAMSRINPSVGPGDIKRHEEWFAEFGSS